MTISISSGSVTQTAYEALRRDILSGRLRPNARLKINELCQSMSLNLSAVREALQRLSSEGLVVAEPQRGFRAAPVSAEDLVDLTRVRIEVETLCLRRSMELGDVTWESRVVAASYALAHTPREPPFERWWTVHEIYHEALCSACDSPWLLRIREMLYVQSERYRQLSTRIGGAKRKADTEHADLVKAVLARDINRVAELVQQHFQLTTDLLLNSLPDQNASQSAAVG